MGKKKLALSAFAAGMLVIVLNLLAEWLINHGLVAADYLISVIAGVLTTLVIFLLFRGRSGKA
jgi:hypothetical protein